MHVDNLQTSLPVLDPCQWGAQLSGPPIVSLRPITPVGVNVRRWSGTSPLMTQPRLTHHFVAMHLGGPKRVTRTGEGGPIMRDASLRSLTIVPAGSVHRWSTQGPIDFAHIYVDPARLVRTVGHVFDREPAGFALTSKVATKDPLLAEIFTAILEAAVTPTPALYLETLFEAFMARLVGEHGNLKAVQTRMPYALAPGRMRAVHEFVESQLAQPITLADLASVAGLSRFHFSRAFRKMEGVPPCTFVTRRRISEARRLLRETDLPIGEVARLCGFESGAQFANAFRRLSGVTPSTYRVQR